MIFPQNLHTHTVLDDAKNTPEEMVQAAISAGLTSLGFSGHSPLPYENDWSFRMEQLPGYFEEIGRLQEKYRGQFPIYCGIEYDAISPMPLAGCQYVIGSLHHISREGISKSVDGSPEEMADYLETWYGGDTDRAAEDYFRQYDALARNEAVDIVGHFDLLTKFNEKIPRFREDSPRYLAAALAAMEQLVLAGKIFELNSGAMSRGWRTSPYPARRLISALRKMGGKITISSDCHDAAAIVCGMDGSAKLARDVGFREAYILKDGAFVPHPL